MDEGVSIEKNHKNKELKSGVIFYLLISLNQKKIALGTISFSLERAPAAGTISNRFFCHHLFK